MLNEERIILMTKLASYEENEGRKNAAIGSYFRSDYIGWQVLKSIISATIAFVVVFAMYIFYDFELFMQDIYKIDLVRFAQNILIYYLIFIGIYMAVCYVVAVHRHMAAQKSLKGYYQNLKKLSKYYKGK